MSRLPRRTFIGAVCATALLGACVDNKETSAAREIDARVDAALEYLYANHPETTELRDKAEGILVVPVITKAGLAVGGSYGRGALRVKDVTVDYYSIATATFGFQFGAHQYSSAMFFMTREALEEFRGSPGLAVGSEVEFVLSRDAENISNETTIVLSPIITVIFGQAGLSAGATVKGLKYTRITL